jgi:hypothetical protein
MLRQREKDLRFWLSATEAGGFEINGHKVGSYNVPSTAWDYNAARDELARLEEMVMALDRLHIKKDISLKDMSDIERREFSILIQAFCKKQPISNMSSDLPSQYTIGICGLRIALVHFEEGCMPGESRVHDFFDKNAIKFECNYRDKRCRVPAYVFLDKEAWGAISNINYEAVASDFQEIFEKENDPILFEIANNTLMPILLAYDKTAENGLLVAAKSLAEWLLNDAPSDSSGDIIHYLNYCQIARRERNLSNEERTRLQQIAEEASERRFKVGANLLLGHQEAAQHHFWQLAEEERDNIRNWPIYRFWRDALQA